MLAGDDDVDVYKNKFPLSRVAVSLPRAITHPPRHTSPEMLNKLKNNEKKLNKLTETP